MGHGGGSSCAVLVWRIFSCSAAEQPCYCFGVALDDLQISARCSIWSLAALFPIAQCPEGDAIKCGELLLRHTELRAESEDIRDADESGLFHFLIATKWKRRAVRIRKSSGV